MTRPAVRITLVLLLVAGLAAAAWQSYVLEKRRLDGLRQQQSLDALRDQVMHGLDDSRTAQQAYLAKGQGLDFWEARFAEAMAGLTQGLTALRAQAEGQPAAIEALDDADRALKVYEGIDRKIRGFVVNGTDLMAADTVYEDGLKTSTIVRTKVDEAVAALVGPARTGYDQRRLQYVLAGTAAGAGLLVSLLLLPTGRSEEPAVELHAPESSLHLNERAGRVDAPVAAPAAEGLSLAPPARVEAPAPAPAPAPAAVAVTAPAEPRRVAGVVGDDALDATARVCTDLARVKDADELRDALGRAARLLDAAGVIVWVTDATGKSLKPLLTYGYPDEALRRIPTLPRDSDNATAAAWRAAVTQVVDATETAPGAIAVPLLVPQGCVGVLAAEIRHGREAAAATRALAQIVAAQLAVLIPSETA
ncbi:GAF domain-containing protein [Luteitalea sp. TBR-22]|uniref:GAF domain-containing protein n=1 Tax=Luteitalea sp. TBR-22 TaxID=2802971 RepID=UPI001EF3E2C0|nr:GAF domain-containing protein [Luteitalea sp. TBR-22]